MKIVTWNVNSLRAREERVAAYLDAHRPDVLCLQETKTEDGTFPRAVFEDRGYAVEAYGQRTYNGVAIASHLPLDDVWRGLGKEDLDDQKRLVAAVAGGLRIVNVYVPNGAFVGSEKFDYKLAWLAALRQLLDDRLDPREAALVCGDFNVAPEERDVHDPRRWEGKVLFSEPEREALRRVLDFGLHDLFRRFTETGGHYTWWDYRMGAFHKGHGLRIDHVFGTEAAADRCTGVVIERDERKGPKPSDHAPVAATFEDATA